jgi:thiol:disulfide interchange protein DsbD
MTAAWCLTCKVNERVALSDARVQAALKAQHIVYMVGDWTHRDAQITRYLTSFGRSGVPLYVYYAPGKAPQVLPQLLTPGLVLKAVNGA